MDDPAPIVTLDDDSGKESEGRDEPQEGEPEEKRRRVAQPGGIIPRDMPSVEQVILDYSVNNIYCDTEGEWPKYLKKQFFKTY